MSAGTPEILTEIFRGFPQPLDANVGVVLRIGHNRFLPNSIQFLLILPSDVASSEILTSVIH
jgi:hypothetical protein